MKTEEMSIQEQLLNAIKKEDVERVEFCLKNGADPNAKLTYSGPTPLYLCLKHPNAKVFEKLVQAGGNVNERIGTEDLPDEEKPSLLHFAVNFTGVQTAIIISILNNGGYNDINYAPIVNGEKMPTPLEIAKMRNRTMLVNLFERINTKAENSLTNKNRR